MGCVCEQRIHGDISILAEHDLWPTKVQTANRENDSFYGDILSINWDPNSKIIPKIERKNKFDRIVKALPTRVRLMLGYRFFLFSKIIKKGLVEESNNVTNPKVLKG